MRRAARWPLLAWCLLLALAAPRRASAKLPASVPHSVACAACNGTLLALAAHVTAQRHRMGLENAVTDALEVVCDQAQRLLTTYAMPPLRMKQGCFALVEHYGDALSAALYARESTDALHTRFCAPICAAVDAAADAARQPADVVRIDNRPLRLRRADGSAMRLECSASCMQRSNAAQW